MFITFNILTMRIPVLLSIVIVAALSSCSADGDFNLFTVDQDVEFGAQLHQEILNNQGTYPILDKSKNPEAYAYIEGMMNEILASDEIHHRNKFPWQVYIIDDDVMNAFAAPGGYLYFYTGIMKYLENGAALAGVMAHEVAHADRRHSTESMTKQYGLQTLLDILLGTNSGMADLLGDLALATGSLKFSRDHEYEADEYAVRYTAESSSKYNPLGIRKFFDQLAADGHTSSTFEFLSTHPSDANRIDNIMEVYESMGSPAGDDYVTKHQGIIQGL